MLIEITKLSYFDTYNTRRKSILFKYNAQNKISEVSQIKIFKKHKSERTFLTYQYDFQHRINSIKIGYAYGDSVKGYDYVYDSNGNLISVNLNGKIIRRYVYNSNGTLVHIANNWGREKGYLKYDD